MDTDTSRVGLGHAGVRAPPLIVEVFGGEKGFSDRYGDHAGLIGHHMQRPLNEPMRRRWIELAIEAADETGWPADPEFRAAFVGYLGWAWGWPPGGPHRGRCDVSSARK